MATWAAAGIVVETAGGDRDLVRPFVLPEEARPTVAAEFAADALGRREASDRIRAGQEREVSVGDVDPRDEGRAGDNVGLLLRGVDKNEIERGMVLAKPNSITPHTQFDAEVYVLNKEEGGRHTPFFNGYRPQFYFRTTDVTGNLSLPDKVEMVMPGDNVEMEMQLITPIAMDEGLRFAIREGGRTVGSGVVTKILG